MIVGFGGILAWCLGWWIRIIVLSAPWLQ